MTCSSTSVHFPDNLSAAKDLSAIACLPSGNLIIGGDEGHAVEVLKQGSEHHYVLEQKLVLVDDPKQDEVDIEDICCDGQTCYVIGSHSRKRKRLKLDKSYHKNRKRLFKAPKAEPTRAVLYQLSVDDNSSISLVQELSLKNILKKDKLLKQFIHIPSKENGIDIEGLAIRNNRLYAGFRSPVLRDNYVPILVVDVKNFKNYDLRFIQMNGRGIRAMTETSEGFLILGGPPGDGTDTYELYFWDGRDMIPGSNIGPIVPLAKLATLPLVKNGKAEGLALLSENQDRFEVLVVFDGIEGGHPMIFQVPKSP